MVKSDAKPERPAPPDNNPGNHPQHPGGPIGSSSTKNPLDTSDPHRGESLAQEMDRAQKGNPKVIGGKPSTEGEDHPDERHDEDDPA